MQLANYEMLSMYILSRDFVPANDLFNRFYTWQASFGDALADVRLCLCLVHVPEEGKRSLKLGTPSRTISMSPLHRKQSDTENSDNQHAGQTSDSDDEIRRDALMKRVKDAKDEDWLTTKETAIVFRRCMRTINRWVDSGKLQAGPSNSFTTVKSIKRLLKQRFKLPRKRQGR